MKRWLSIVALLGVAAVTPLVAQQASTPAPQARATTVLAGPRLPAAFPRAQPAFAHRSASGSAVVSDTHTITVTTLVLVLVVIILVLLIAK